MQDATKAKGGMADYLREFVGLLAHRRKALVQPYAVVTPIYLAAQHVLTVA